MSATTYNFEPLVLEKRKDNFSNDLEKVMDKYRSYTAEFNAIMDAIRKGNIKGIVYDDNKKCYDFERDKKGNIKEKSELSALKGIDKYAQLGHEMEQRFAFLKEVPKKEKEVNIDKIIKKEDIKTKIANERRERENKRRKENEEYVASIKTTKPLKGKSVNEEIDEMIADFGPGKKLTEKERKELENKSLDDLFNEVNEYVMREDKKKKK